MRGHYDLNVAPYSSYPANRGVTISVSDAVWERSLFDLLSETTLEDLATLKDAADRVHQADGEECAADAQEAFGEELRTILVRLFATDPANWPIPRAFLNATETQAFRDSIAAVVDESVVSIQRAS